MCPAHLLTLRLIEYLGRTVIQNQRWTTLGNIKATNLESANKEAILSEVLKTQVVAPDAFDKGAEPIPKTGELPKELTQAL